MNGAVSSISTHLMYTTILSNHYGLVKTQINNLEKRIVKNRNRFDNLQSLLSEASTALQTLEDASNQLPGSFVQNLQQAVLNTFQISIQKQLKPSVNRSISLIVKDSSSEILYRLQAKNKITNQHLPKIMNACFGGTDAEGIWQWKDAYEVLEMALIRHIQQNNISELSEAIALENLCPTHTRRTEESVDLQQFSTPLPLGYIVTQAAGLTADDIVLESSAGNGLLAVWAEKAGAKLILNEIASQRRQNLTRLFPTHLPVFAYNGEQIHDYLTPYYQPTVALLNPPFCTSPKVAKRNANATFGHLYSALQRLPQGGRLVAITADWFTPENPKWEKAFAKLGELGTVIFSVGIDGKLYRKQGTTIATRLTVIDKGREWESPYIKSLHCDDAHHLLSVVQNYVPPRVTKRSMGKGQKAKISFLEKDLNPLQDKALGNPSISASSVVDKQFQSTTNNLSLSSPAQATPQIDWQDVAPITYSKVETRTTALDDSLYQQYQPQTITVTQAKDHPTALVQSAAMASIRPPLPSYQAQLPQQIITQGILSAPQVESIIYAGEAHSKKLSHFFTVDESLEKIKISKPNNKEAVQFRQGWLLGDGTGAGKGRQAAGIILDNWLQGRTKALWISKSDKLIEDARRDWIALGGDKNQLISLQKFRQGQKIELDKGIMFATYALLRGKGRQGKISRVEQLLQWLGTDFDGVIIFDECHAMGSALASKGSRGTQKPSQQGLAGLRLQYGLPDARVVYVSATGATKVSNLAYACRLGLWQSADFPFTNAQEFIASVEQGGLAAMEVVSRDLKSLGLYASRSLSYQGVEYDILEHELTEGQIDIYDSYAKAYQIIYQNLEQALEATHIVSNSGITRNGQAKSAARSAFESSKQRFFNHLLTAMKMPTLLKAMEQDIEAGHAVIVQIVSTNEALLERRLAEIPVSEWDDLNIDVTPREYIMDYLTHAFPIQLHEIYSDDEGNQHSKPAVDEDCNPVLCQEALAKRDAMIESLALLPPIPGALDQIIHHFGYEQVAEVTGRSKRIIRENKEGQDKLKISNRPASANLAEVRAFLDDIKPILIFSEAGGTGASYHAALTEKNQRQRIHYLLEAGWRADNAIQGLGRSHRSHQKQPPIFRPVTTNVKGEKRFLSTIAKRLDSLGALTKGQRETGSQGIFKQEDNLESIYARISLNKLYYAIYHGQLSFCSLEQFQNSTGLQLQAHDSATLKQNLPPMTQFLNRLLALRVELQNQLFEAFELRLEQEIEMAKTAGTFEVGVEVLKAESLTVAKSEIIYTHSTGAKTTCHEIIRKDKAEILTLEKALEQVKAHQGRLLHNDRSSRVCLEIPTNSILEEDGSITPRVSLLRPQGNEKVRTVHMASSHWQAIDMETFSRLWKAEMEQIPAYKQSRFYLVTGLLLPIWKRIDTESMKIWRLQTDDGQNLLGRYIPAENIGSLYSNLGMNVPTLSAEEIYHAVFERHQCLPVGRWQLRSSRISGRNRIELLGFSGKSEADVLKTYGCFSEIINWKLRLFIPANDNAVSVVEKLMKMGD